MSDNVVTGIAWRAGAKPDAHGDIITKEAMEKAIESGIDLPVTLINANTHSVGRVIDVKVGDNGDLLVQAEITDPLVLKLIKAGSVAFRPGFMVKAMTKQEDGTVLIEQIDMLHVSAIPTEHAMKIPPEGDLSGLTDDECPQYLLKDQP